MKLKEENWGINVVKDRGIDATNDIGFGVDNEGKAAFKLGDTVVNEDTIGGGGGGPVNWATKEDIDNLFPKSFIESGYSYTMKPIIDLDSFPDSINIDFDLYFRYCEIEGIKVNPKITKIYKAEDEGYKFLIFTMVLPEELGGGGEEDIPVYVESEWSTGWTLFDEYSFGPIMMCRRLFIEEDISGVEIPQEFIEWLQNNSTKHEIPEEDYYVDNMYIYPFKGYDEEYPVVPQLLNEELLFEDGENEKVFKFPFVLYAFGDFEDLEMFKCNKIRFTRTTDSFTMEYYFENDVIFDGEIIIPKGYNQIYKRTTIDGETTIEWAFEGFYEVPIFVLWMEYEDQEALGDKFMQWMQANTVKINFVEIM